MIRNHLFFPFLSRNFKNMIITIINVIDQNKFLCLIYGKIIYGINYNVKNYIKKKALS